MTSIDNEILNVPYRMSAEIFKETGKRLIQPKVTPPEASDEVSEPLVSHLVSNYGCNEDFIDKICICIIVQKVCLPVKQY